MQIIYDDDGLVAAAALGLKVRIEEEEEEEYFNKAACWRPPICVAHRTNYMEKIYDVARGDEMKTQNL